MIARLSIVVWLALFGCLTVLLIWAGFGFDHAALYHWHTESSTVKRATGPWRHSEHAIIAFSAFLGLVWCALGFVISTFIVWAWNGYEE